MAEGGAAASVDKLLNEATECTICADVFKNPKLLRCGHTFCLGCLEQWGKDKMPGGKAECPLCRKEITIDVGRFKNLQTNINTETLLNVKNLPKPVTADEEEPPQCDECFFDCEEATVVAVLASRQESQKEKESEKEKVADVDGSYCVLHPTKLLEVYCNDCSEPNCVMCCIQRHNGHKHSDISLVSEDFRQQLKDYIDKLAVNVLECKGKLENAKKMKAYCCG
jgi:hypothetical protein